MRFRRIIKDTIMWTPTSIWLINDAASTPASAVVGQVVREVNKEFNTVEDARYNKPVVSIGVGVWDHIEDVRTLEVEIEDNVVRYDVDGGGERDEDELNPDHTHYVLVDTEAGGDARTPVRRAVDAITKRLCEKKLSCVYPCLLQMKMSPIVPHLSAYRSSCLSICPTVQCQLFWPN